MQNQSRCICPQSGHTQAQGMNRPLSRLYNLCIVWARSFISSEFFAKRLQDASLDHEKTLLSRQVEATDAAIDKLVYEL